MRRVSKPALTHMRDQCHKADSWIINDADIPTCTGSYKRTLGVPCAHDFMPLIHEDGVLPFDPEYVHPYWHVHAKTTMDVMAREIDRYVPLESAECEPDAEDLAEIMGNPITNEYGSLPPDYTLPPAAAPGTDPVRDPRVPAKRPRKSGTASGIWSAPTASGASAVGAQTPLGVLEDPMPNRGTRFVNPSERVMFAFERSALYNKPFATSSEDESHSMTQLRLSHPWIPL
jgi:hypothetical protein